MTFTERARAEAEKYADENGPLPGLHGGPRLVARDAVLFGAEWAARDVREREVSPLKETLSKIRNDTIIWLRKSESATLRQINQLASEALEAQAARERGDA